MASATSVHKGWKIFFTREETEMVANGVDIAAIVSAVIPEPATATVASVAPRILAFYANRALKINKRLGLEVNMPSPNFPVRTETIGPPVWPFRI
ncbi:hypothetical protein ThrDRAFT_02760 [Frankia casuarinae]|jgi:hypothetical protein|nr:MULTISPECIES: hypothetical protein [unclassified Frankia]ETA01181.1 hypothetical protein CcI6DRAFT_03426 [Frankia sp. CcI6]EYT91636.1 hypothetical protein ThrDRAFT_02760 [Frankia casuarinae]KDA41245.1 hypothetical protein BMG523Draft_03930 [Frankia sp. BMG5.23]KFB03699.1 hypothetical protein ALLO2DRAFT_03503 [Frankia sp. Allo2]ORT48108.1 hypothetical protein KBI5_16050 [Frankia sp. KB5]